MAFDWDREVFAPVAGIFGQQVRYQPQRGTPYLIDDATFEEAYEGIELTPDAPMATSERATLEVRTADMPTPPERNDKVTILRTGETFVVANVEPDTHGRALLQLEFQSRRRR